MLPLNLNAIEPPSSINMAKVLKECKLIVCDESSMSHSKELEVLKNCLKNLKNSNSIMGRVTVLLAGYLHLTLLVIPRETHANVQFPSYF